MATYYLETDLEKIKTLGTLNKEENEQFKQLLKHRNVHKTDVMVHRLNDEIAPRIDCTVCGNCCKELTPYLTHEDLKQMAIATRRTVEEALSAFTEKDEQGIALGKDMPCCFLADNMCTIYQHRPGTCQSFPHLHKPDFNSRLRSVMDNYSICPIIFNVIERMKLELEFE